MQQVDKEEADRLDEEHLFRINFPEERDALSPQEIVDTFPEGLKTVKLLIKDCEAALEEYQINRDNTRAYLSITAPMYQVDTMVKIVMSARYGDLEGRLAEKLKRLKRLYHLYTPQKKADGFITDHDIARAKQYPIHELVEVKRGNARCVWHTDKNPSMKFYPSDNHVFCFVCQRAGDAINVYQALKNCDFVTAVKALL